MIDVTQKSEVAVFRIYNSLRNFGKVFYQDIIYVITLRTVELYFTYSCEIS